MRHRLLVVAALLLVMSACTDSDSDTTTTSTADTTPPTTAATTSTEPSPTTAGAATTRATTTAPSTTAAGPPPTLAAPPPAIQASLQQTARVKPAPYPGPSRPASLDGIAFIESVPTDRRDDLVRDGFVIDPTEWATQFSFLYESVYPYGGRPVFVTTDAAYHHWHLVFDKVLRDIEQARLLPVLEDMVTRLVAGARAQETSLSGTELQAAATGTREHLEAVATLLELDVGPIGPAATAEVALVIDHTERTASPTIGGECEPACVDYSLMKPRGHYTRTPELTRYFLAMSLLGNTPFSIDDADSLRGGLLLSRLVVTDPQLTEAWVRIYQPTAFLVGAADDYTPFEAALAAQTILPLGLTDPLPLTDDGVVLEVGAALTDLRAVEIDPSRPSLRTMPVRFVYDSWVFQNLVHPVVDRRVKVSPLDLAAVFGSDWALSVQEDNGEAVQFPDYEPAVSELRTVTNERTIDEWGATVYDAWLYALEPVWMPHGAAYPPFMQGEAWAAKAHQTGFGSYTELRHDTILYAKQAMAEGDMEPPPQLQHWVEPDPVAFGRLAAAATLMRDGLTERDLLAASDDANRELLDRFIELAGFLERVARAELAADPISEPDNDRIGEVGVWLAVLLHQSSDFELDRYSGLVADVFLDLANDEVLEIGTGRVEAIHVLVPDGKGGFQVATGGVYSYYEFWQPRSDRLSDEDWWQLLDTGTEPERPPWLTAPLGL